MNGRAFFGPPLASMASGGLQVTVHVVPVLEGKLVAFDVTAAEARGRWLPWSVIDYAQNPYEAASLLVDDWCDVPLDDMALVDVMSLPAPGEGWELALVFRAVLAAAPRGDAERRPHVYEAGDFDAFGAFDPVDLQRWVQVSPPTSGGEAGLIF